MLLLVIIEYQLVPGFAWFWSFAWARGEKLSLFWEMNYQSLKNHKDNLAHKNYIILRINAIDARSNLKVLINLSSSKWVKVSLQELY